MAYEKDLFKRILKRGIRKGLVAGEERARVWFRDQANRKFFINRDKLMNNRPGPNQKTTVKIGSMYMYVYDPKLKDELPYYDRFPLIFPVDVDRTGFYGINFHYLPYELRAELMDALHTITNNKRYDSSTKVKLSYEVLKGASKFGPFKPCFKRYLWSHVKSQFVLVEAAEWDIALFLRIEDFAKASKAKVWRESMEKM